MQMKFFKIKSRVTYATTENNYKHRWSLIIHRKTTCQLARAMHTKWKDMEGAISAEFLPQKLSASALWLQPIRGWDGAVTLSIHINCLTLKPARENHQSHTAKNDNQCWKVKIVLNTSFFQDVFIALEELTAKTGYQDFTVRTSREFSLRRELRWAASPLKETKMSNYCFKKVYQN